MDWNWDFALSILPDLLRGLLVTVQITLCAMALAVPLGLLLAVGRRSSSRFVSIPAYYVIEVVRSTPLLLQLFFLFFMLPEVGIVLPAMATGIVGLGIHYATYCAETYRGGIDSVPKGQWEAAVACNLSKFDTWCLIVLPQAIPPMIPALANYLIGMFKESALVSAVTVIELMNAARMIANSSYRYFEPMTMVGLLYLAVSVPASLAVRKLEKRFKPADGGSAG
ncbi:ectoine/hydroxyectoine ABC transporter permease subunit EhuD [Mesorhizobium erdmanii]|uniref:Ectoine/hydroxyectoine ABC transporter permease subunit EhuD n=2 Tax=Mesorhizobium TaxID=68287 RepID=A0A3M9WYR9_9HYPH|nr:MULTISPECIES: ectoine/hydroxyectoine ABC transporter permease subunit EhuD [Mesorhizobium]RNJ41074.1 ectoine/hydroxyectoine ABC transporter permease subunit EhuD [Mesorhizobium japonicum]RXT45884.1 ectoine/hydroxyectoine ABC transporter permease subunit EhuD [Mesorhizobium erdmanii]